MIGFTFASSVILAALSLSDAQDSPTPSPSTYPPTVTEFPTSSTYEPTITEYPTYFETYDPTITAYPTSETFSPTTIESPTVTLAMAVSEARRQQNAAGTKKLSLKGAAANTEDGEPCGQDDEDGTGTDPTSARKGSEKRSQRHEKRAAKRAAMKEKRSAKKQSRMEKRAAMKEKRSAKRAAMKEKRSAKKEKRSVKRSTRKDDWACVAQCGKTRSDDTEKCLAECRNPTSVPPDGDESPLEIA